MKWRVEFRLAGGGPWTLHYEFATEDEAKRHAEHWRTLTTAWKFRVVNERTQE